MAARVLAPMVLGRNTGPTRRRRQLPGGFYPVSCQHGGAAGMQFPGNPLKRFRIQRELALEVIQQVAGQGLHGHSPIRCARWVKKIPLGLLAGSVAVLSRLAVS